MKIVLAAAATILFAVGLYVGFELAKPPQRPDFGTAPGDPTPGARAPGDVISDDVISDDVISDDVIKRDDWPGVPEPTDQRPQTETPMVEPDLLEPSRIQRQPPPRSGGAPRISIVIDDLGRGLRDLEALASLGITLTYSVLPFEARTAQVVAELRARGVEYMCHLPMQAKGDVDPGPGALLLSMSRDQLRQATRQALAAVPGAAGVNNHMGSAMLPRQEAIEPVLEVLARQGLYFLDSRTSADTVGYTLARDLGLRAAERQVFLDTVRDGTAIRGQFDALLASARKRGGAIAIAHPHPVTIEVLAAAIPAARAEGFEFVTVSALLEG